MDATSRDPATSDASAIQPEKRRTLSGPLCAHISHFSNTGRRLSVSQRLRIFVGMLACDPCISGCDLEFSSLPYCSLL